MRKFVFLITIAIILLFVSCDINLDEDIEVSYNITSSGQISLANKSAKLPQLLEIPSTVDGIEVTSLSSGMFFYHDELKYVILPVTITEIPYEAFYRCSSLYGVFAPGGITKIGERAFYKCTSLGGLDTSSVKYVYVSAFQGCSSYEKIDLSSVEQLWDYAFMDCSNLKQVTLGENLKYRVGGDYILGNNIFVGCNKLENFEVDSDKTNFYTIDDNKGLVANYNGKNRLVSYPTASGAVTLPSDIIEIESGAFSGCTGLTSVDFPDNLKSIGSIAFKNCTSLTSISIPTSVTTIESSAFKNCTCPLVFEDGRKSIADGQYIDDAYYSINLAGASFSSISIPASVEGNLSGLSGCSCPIILTGSRTEIPEYFFQYCSSIPSITMPESVTTIGSHAFSGCTRLQKVKISKNVTTISETAFEGCTGTVVFSSGMSTIPAKALYNSNVSAVAIPKSVTTIGVSAFANCSYLDDIYYEGTIDEWNDEWDKGLWVNIHYETYPGP